MKSSIVGLLSGVVLTTLVPSVNALTLLPNPTVIGSAPATPGFGVQFALDNNLLTDYASAGQGVNTFIDFDFGTPVLISQVNYTDRTTSSGSQGFGGSGLNDNVTGFDLIFSSNPSFSSPIASVSVLSPGFANTDIVPINGSSGIVARYLRWDVTSRSGSETNNGAAEFQFFTTTTTPEPSSLLGFITLGGLMLGGAVRKAKK